MFIVETLSACRLPVLVGSGVTADNVADYTNADALIVGSYFKHNGDWTNELDTNRIQTFMEALNKYR